MLEQILPKEELTPTEATLMMAGITLDTKNFSKSTGTRTFGAALYLRDRGASSAKIQELNKTGLDDYMREGKFRTNVTFYRGNLAITAADNGADAGPADRITAAKAADNLLSVEGVEASFALVKIGESVSISARSAGKINVQLILEKLKGGGHFDSAGAQVEGELAAAEEMLKAAIDEYLGEKSETN
jgi:c-di-AMP phosphodiesterase-like protein